MFLEAGTPNIPASSLGVPLSTSQATEQTPTQAGANVAEPDLEAGDNEAPLENLERSLRSINLPGWKQLMVFVAPATLDDQALLPGDELGIDGNVFWDAHTGGYAQSERAAEGACRASATCLETSPSTFFARWSRPVQQSREQWEIERRILSGKPYDLDTFSDPMNLRLKHVRYGRDGYKHRPYFALYAQDAVDDMEGMCQGSLSCISFAYGKIENEFIGWLLVDTSRMYAISEVSFPFRRERLPREGPVVKEKLQPCFIEDESQMALLLGKLAELGDGSVSPDDVVRVLVGLVVEDMERLLKHLNDGIDFVDFSLTRESYHDLPVSSWRSLLVYWRFMLLRHAKSLDYMIDREERSCREAQCDEASTLTSKLRELDATADYLRSRIDSTFQMLMSTLSITESQRAIAQTAAVTKLTNLGFFFIPLSFIGTLFSMNVAEFDDKATWPTWLGSSLGVLALTYLVFFWSELVAQRKHLPRLAFRGVREFLSLIFQPSAAVLAMSATFLSLGILSLSDFFADGAISSSDLIYPVVLTLLGFIGVITCLLFRRTVNEFLNKWLFRAIEIIVISPLVWCYQRLHTRGASP